MDADIERHNNEHQTGRMCLQNKLKYLQTIAFINCSVPAEERLYTELSKHTPHCGKYIHTHL